MLYTISYAIFKAGMYFLSYARYIKGRKVCSITCYIKGRKVCYIICYIKGKNVCYLHAITCYIQGRLVWCIVVIISSESSLLHYSHINEHQYIFTVGKFLNWFMEKFIPIISMVLTLINDDDEHGLFSILVAHVDSFCWQFVSWTNFRPDKTTLIGWIR